MQILGYQIHPYEGKEKFVLVVLNEGILPEAFAMIKHLSQVDSLPVDQYLVKVTSNGANPQSPHAYHSGEALQQRFETEEGEIVVDLR